MSRKCAIPLTPLTTARHTCTPSDGPSHGDSLSLLSHLSSRVRAERSRRERSDFVARVTDVAHVVIFTPQPFMDSADITSSAMERSMKMQLPLACGASPGSSKALEERQGHLGTEPLSS
jgi:hypothetical protein